MGRLNLGKLYIQRIQHYIYIYIFKSIDCTTPMDDPIAFRTA